jgi:hypothetical protein
MLTATSTVPSETQLIFAHSSMIIVTPESDGGHSPIFRGRTSPTIPGTCLGLRGDGARWHRRYDRGGVALVTKAISKDNI